MQPTEEFPEKVAARTLDTVRAARETTNEQLDPYWFGLVVFGVLTMVSSQLFELWDGGGVAFFWLLAAPVGLFVVDRHQRAQAAATGGARGARPYAFAALTLTAAAAALGAVGGAMGNADIPGFGTPLVIAAAYFYFAWRTGSAAFAAWAGTVVAATIVFAATDQGGLADILILCCGGNFLLMGLSERRSQHR